MNKEKKNRRIFDENRFMIGEKRNSTILDEFDLIGRDAEQTNKKRHDRGLFFAFKSK